MCKNQFLVSLSGTLLAFAINVLPMMQHLPKWGAIIIVLQMGLELSSTQIFKTKRKYHRYTVFGQHK